jgi:lysophospholipase L1-like esterase
MGLGLAGAAFAYGAGVGRYDWPPASWLRSVREQIFGVSETKLSVAKYISARLSIFSATPGRADIIMLGDSLTEHGNWHELLPNTKVMNRGISGDTSSGILARLAEVISRQPRLAFLMVGVNDLADGATPEAVAENTSKILRSLQVAQISPVLQSVLFVGDGQRDINFSIEQLNTRLRELALKMRVPFLDLNPLLAPSGRLAPEFTYDGLHLKGTAYLRWGDAIKESLLATNRDDG